MRLRLDQRHRAAHRGRRKRAKKADRPAADHRDLVARVDPVGRHRGAVRDRERLHERTLRKGELVGNPVQPRRLGDEVLGVGAADREPEVVVAVVDDALADDAVTRPQPGHAAPHLGDLTGPLVARDDRIRHRDDVAALEELEVGVADADIPRTHEHLVGRDRRDVDLGHRRAPRFLENQRFHPQSLLIARSAP